MATINGDIGDNLLDGTSDDDIIKGFSGRDTLNGLEGNDILHGGQGTDEYWGGDGNDWFVLANDETISSEVYRGGAGTDRLIITNSAAFNNLNLDATASVEQIDFSNGFLTGTDGADIFDITGVTEFRNFVNIIDLGSGNDVFHGAEIADWVTGGNGKDTLHGNGGDDSLRGGLGNDAYHGGDGDDRFLLVDGETVFDELYRGGNGTDTLVITNSAAFRNLSLDAAASVEQIDFSNGFLTGTRFDDMIDISGVTSLVNFANPIDLDVGDDTFIGSADNDRVNGNRGHDALFGMDGNDRLVGAKGKDTLDGGAGDDRLSGGNGTDTYIYNSGADVITGFSGDLLHLDDILWAEASLTNAQVLAFASVVAGNTVFDFGSGNTLTIENYTDIAGLDPVLTIV